MSPNFSKRIMGRESDVICRVLISATEATMREREEHREGKEEHLRGPSHSETAA